jgi:hypothetical protein
MADKSIIIVFTLEVIITFISERTRLLNLAEIVD